MKFQFQTIKKKKLKFCIQNRGKVFSFKSFIFIPTEFFRKKERVKLFFFDFPSFLKQFDILKDCRRNFDDFESFKNTYIYDADQMSTLTKAGSFLLAHEETFHICFILFSLKNIVNSTTNNANISEQRNLKMF